MPRAIAEKVERVVAELRRLLARSSTLSVVGTCLNYCIHRANDPSFNEGLVSPARQLSFLLGLLVSTPEPKEPEPFDDARWAQTRELLNEAFGSYQEIFWPDAAEIGQLTDEWKRTRQVAMPAFLHYFNSGILANPEQIKERIELQIDPFDDAIRARVGASAAELLAIAEWITGRLQRALDGLNEAIADEKASRLALLDEAEHRELDLEGLRALAERSGHRSKAEALFRALDDLGRVRFQDLLEAFPKTGRAYWDLFTIGRGTGPVIAYPTEESVFDVKPLILIDEGSACCPSVNDLFTAILKVGDELLSEGPTKERFLRRRDIGLEHQVAQAFASILDKSASIYTNLYETPDSHLEHDLIAVSGRALFIVESKSRPPIEPFRDPDRAFTRLKHAFGSDRGIQGAFDQAARVRRRLDAGEEVELFDENGKRVVVIKPQDLPNRFCICVTHDDFGALATDLKLLLEKQDNEAFPWAVNILDLQQITEAWQYLKWGTAELAEYLDLRTRLHGKVFGFDELEFVGFHIRHRQFPDLVRSDADMIMLDPSYSQFFDELYRHQRYGTPAPSKAVKPAFMSDLKKSLAAGKPVPVGPTETPSPSRNAPCSCGSGRRFKNCHGKDRGG